MPGRACRAIPVLLEQTTVLLKEGLSWLTPRGLLATSPSRSKTRWWPEKNALLETVSPSFRPRIPEADRARIRSEAANVLKERVIPAFAQFHDFFVRSYLPKPRERLPPPSCRTASVVCAPR